MSNVRFARSVTIQCYTGEGFSRRDSLRDQGKLVGLPASAFDFGKVLGAVDVISGQ